MIYFPPKREGNMRKLLSPFYEKSSEDGREHGPHGLEKLGGIAELIKLRVLRAKDLISLIIASV